MPGPQEVPFSGGLTVFRSFLPLLQYGNFLPEVKRKPQVKKWLGRPISVKGLASILCR